MWLLGVLSAVALGGTACGGGLPPAGTYGTPGYRFVISFTEPPTERIIPLTTPTVEDQYGTAVVHRVIWSGGNADVWVDQLANPLRPAQIDGFLRSYLPTSHGGRVVTRFGFPAAVESVPCSTPAGSCPGNIAVLAVLDGTTVYEVHASEGASTDQAIISSFRIFGSSP